MTPEEVLGDLRKKFKDDIVEILDERSGKIYIGIKQESLVKVARYIFKDLKARFNTASGVDMQYHMEILYHFLIEDINLLISLRVKLQKSKLEIDSLSPIFEGANWIEREMHEILGINFKGHPDLKRLLLPDDWPDGVYPLRRDYKEWDKNVIRDRGV